MSFIPLPEIKAAESPYAGPIYVDVPEYENAYWRYKLNGDAVEVRGRLLKGKTPVGEAFNVKGKKDDMPGLVEAIVEKVSGMLE